MTEQEYHRWKELFYKKEEKFFEMLAGEQEKEGLLLSLYVRFATDLYKAYVEKEIPDEVYDATFSDFTIWYIESCGADGFLKWAYDAWCKDPLEENVHCYFEAGDMFLVYPGERREKEPDVRVSPRFRMLEEAIRERLNPANIVVMDTAGVSSMYANDGGVIVAV